MRSPPDTGAIIVAAGRGVRAGGAPKQFRLVGGVPMLLRALRPFLANAGVGPVVVVLPPDVAADPPDWLAPLVGERLRVVAGGSERMASVAAGVAALGQDLSVIVVHDGARPFVDPAVIDAVVAVARTGTSAVAGVPVSDTLKEARADTAHPPLVDRTVPRERLWRAQTPQAFPADVLRRALAAAAAAGLTVTDEAQAVEVAGGNVALVLDRSSNIKITTEDDFALADAMAAVT